MTGWDFIVVGSGFGGSVSALRLAEKGYRVLVLEKGKRWAKEDFPKSNWRLRKWLWNPAAGLRGFFQMSFLKHVTVLHGVGVGGGSLVYANTLPVPKDDFFAASSWAELADWKGELAPHYATAKRMLGATPNPNWTRGDEVLAEIAKDIGREDHHHPTEVAVYFGQPDETVPDPFFDGEGPEHPGMRRFLGDEEVIQLLHDLQSWAPFALSISPVDLALRCQIEEDKTGPRTLSVCFEALARLCAHAHRHGAQE